MADKTHDAEAAALEKGMAQWFLIKDERSFEWWLGTLNRETETTTVVGEDYREVHVWRYFENGNNASLDAAKREVCLEMYFKLKADLNKDPTGKIVWRREPEFEIVLKDQDPLPKLRSWSPCKFAGYMRFKIVAGALAKAAA